MQKIINNKLEFEKVGPMILPSRIGGGTFDLYLYTFNKTKNHYFVLTKGKIFKTQDVLVRIDSNCVWVNIFGSARCDCAEQLHDAMRRIIKEKRGVLIHAYNQDGRGLSLKDHVRVYMEQDKGYDTIEADYRCGFKNPDRRDYQEIITILKSLKLKSIRLLTNNPNRIKALNDARIKTERVAIESVKIDKYNIAQLYMKKKVLGHMFSAFDLNNKQFKKLFKQSLKKYSHDEYDSYLWEC